MEDNLLLDSFHAKEEMREMAQKLGMEIRETLQLLALQPSTLDKISYSFAKKHQIVPIEEDENQVTVAVSNPIHLDPIDDLRWMLSKEIRVVYTPQREIASAIDLCYQSSEGKTHSLIKSLSSENKEASPKEDRETYDLLDIKDEAPIIRLLNLVLSEAIQQGASDIHFEPFENDLKIRYRIDGVLFSRHSPAQEHQSALLTRIKVLAKLDIAEHRLPQDGRMKLMMGGREIDFRVSTIPALHGERIVLRLLDKENIVLGLDKLGMLPRVLDLFQNMISTPEGIVLVTGPTGSGKTTTLYSALCEIYTEETNIMTIEDPVEYKLKGIAQMGVRPKIGLSFASGLRSILRQDPDVVMVGEIRDKETAEIAIQAALTGHLVVSTLHTNDAPSAIPRLIDMGIEPYLLSSTLIGVLAQRLLRTICPNCREGYTPSESELSELQISREELLGGKLYRGRGCKQCFNSGYKGRHGIYELMPLTPPLQKEIINKRDASVLREIACEQKMVTLKQHGIHLVRSGMTTFCELLRVHRGT